MDHTTLFVTVGRAIPRPLCTVKHDRSDYEALLAATELQERVSLVNGGVAAERISFSRETTEIEEPVTAKPKKGKG